MQLLNIPSPRHFRLWNSERLGWAVTGLTLVLGVPLFLRMPPWCDLTLYEVAARNVITGGVHYRDVFDTNPPGFVWSLVAVRTLFGSSVEAVRAVDLCMVATTVVLLGRWVRLAGGPPAGVAWMAAGMAMFYPFTDESNHCQRDVWMMPAVVTAGLLRVRRLGRPESGSAFRAGVIEGLILGAAAWVKPHALLPAAAVWLVTFPSLARRSVRPGMAAAGDFAGNAVGGLIALGFGLAWLVNTGAWTSFAEVFTFWNTGYLRLVSREFDHRWPLQLSYFPPWSLLQPVAVVLAVISLVRHWWRPVRMVSHAGHPLDLRIVRAALSALFLAWVGQALIIQRHFHYVHVPEVLLMLAVFASLGSWVVFAGWAFVIIWVALGWAYHPITDRDRVAWWPACWRVGLTRTDYAVRRNALGFRVDCFNGIDWVQIGEVTDYLDSRLPSGDRAGKVIAWHDTPHALYLTLGVRPGFRFMHVSTVTNIGQEQYERLRDELHVAAPKAQFVVADLERVFDTGVPGEREAMEAPGPGPRDLLPPALRTRFPRVAVEFPFDQTPVFRSAGGRGRYVVFRLDRPVTPECRISRGLGIDLPAEGDE